MIRRLLAHRLHLGILVAAATLGCKKADDTAKTEKASVAAQTVIVVRQPFTETLGAIGSVSARAGHAAALSAPAPGHIAKVLVTTGQKVAAGQAVIELDQAPFVAAVLSAEAALNAAERAYARQQRLADGGIVPRKDAESAATDVAKARADAAAARRSAALSILHSQINGVVTRLTASLGASVDPSQVLVEIADLSALDVLFNVTPTDAGRIHPGARVTLSAGQDAGGEPLGVGTVVDVGGTVDSLTRSVAVRAQAPTTRRPLRIGETVYGLIAVQFTPSAIVVPIEALVPEGQGFKVFVVDASGMAHERDITVGGKTDKVAEITEGLTVGERIATQGAYGLADSAKVVPLKPVDTTSKKPPETP
jgi:membrane fusion protein (multidrug efflux system)